MSKRTLQEAASELRRELGIRRRCYSRWIADGKLDEVEACDRVERMELALDVVERAALLATAAPDWPTAEEEVGQTKRSSLVPAAPPVEVSPVPSVSPVLVTRHSTAQGV